MSLCGRFDSLPERLHAQQIAVTYFHESTVLFHLKERSSLLTSFKIIDQDLTKLGAFQAGLKQLLTYLLWAADLLKHRRSSLNSPRFCLWSLHQRTTPRLINACIIVKIRSATCVCECVCEAPASCPGAVGLFSLYWSVFSVLFRIF